MLSNFHSSAILMAFLAVSNCSLAWADRGTSQDTSVSALTYLYSDRQVEKEEYIRAWGLVTLIEFDGKRILFDTGGDPEVLKHNMQLAGIDPESLDLIVISHHHWEMVGGAQYLLDHTPKTPLVSTDHVIGVLQDYQKSRGDQPVWDLRTMGASLEVTPNILLMKLHSKPMHGGPFGIQEIHAVLKTKDGLVILQGCGHPEVVNILEKSQESTGESQVHMISGGTQLLDPGKVVDMPPCRDEPYQALMLQEAAPFPLECGVSFEIPQRHSYSDDDVKKIANQLQSAGLQKIVPTLCTGERAETIFARQFGTGYTNQKLGMTLELPAVPQR